MRTPLFLISLVFACTIHAAPPPICQTLLGGSPPPTPLTLINESANFFDLDASNLDEGSLGRLSEAMRPKPYFGRPAPNGFTAYLFDVGYAEDVDVIAALTKVRLGLRLKRDGEEVKVRVILPMVNLDPLPATAQALTDLINHFDLLRRPTLLTREMNMLHADLTRLLEVESALIIKPAFVKSALKLLDEALDLRAPLTHGRSAFLGKRFAAYHRARQMLVHAWLTYNVAERRAMAQDLLLRYRPAGPHGAPAELINSEEVINQATRGAHLFGRPWGFTIDRQAYYATKMWFELLAGRGIRAAEGGLFLSERFVGDLNEEQLARFDHRGAAGAAPAVTPDEDKTESSLRNTAEGVPAPAVHDPTQTATGLPDPGGGDVGIGGVEPSDTGPAGPV